MRLESVKEMHITEGGKKIRVPKIAESHNDGVLTVVHSNLTKRVV
ncbi:hypothetical protein CHITON_1138 [Thermococcus chitonophagus]|uniref:Uncharacterized protein n=1 Tax=Thermococcus chitonophagus TaxID=54262 RepID=A0A160VSB6_9EURY|nr:hypothetical protein CHITON_1138 [Thermococcus chitonophagus]